MEAVARRLERQSASCRETLALASVIGREFDPAVVEALSGAEEEVYRALEEAASARLLAVLPNAPGRLRFSHVLIRDALYESIPAPRRVRLHRAIGQALEMLYSANPEPHLAEIARHFLAGGTPVREKAIEYAMRAGDRAASQLAHEEAVRHYTSALQVLDATGSGDADRTCELLLSLGEALSRAGRSSEAKEVLRRAATLAERTGRTDRLACAAVEYGGRLAWSRASTDPFLVPLLERALAAIGEADSAERVKLLARLATATRDDPSRTRRSSDSRGGGADREAARRPGDARVRARGPLDRRRRPRHRGRRYRTRRDAGQAGRADGRQGACARRPPIPAERLLDARRTEWVSTSNWTRSRRSRTSWASRPSAGSSVPIRRCSHSWRGDSRTPNS